MYPKLYSRPGRAHAEGCCIVGDGIGKAVEPALSDFGKTGSRAAAAIGDLFNGGVSTTPASVDGAEKANP
jgi:hypothetical protein